MIVTEDSYGAFYLHSKPITGQEAQRLNVKLPLKERPVEMSTCPACYEVLGKWTKDELVKKLIQVFPLARTVFITGGKVQKGR